MLIPRRITQAIDRLIQKYPLIGITGPRQAGKTTLLMHLFPDYQYVSLENPDNREYAQKDPNGFLETYSERVIFDEVQRTPELFSYLQTKTDLDQKMGQYILSGSQNFLLMKSISQSLAGRVTLFRLLPLSFSEMIAGGLVPENLEDTIFTGFYPAIFDRKIPPVDYYPNYVETYLERDVQSIIAVKDLQQFQTFMRLCAGHTGQLINYKSLADGCGISPPTAKEWLSVLERSYIVFTLSPYYRNFNRRLVKSPKLYFYDTGLVCYLLGMKQATYVSSYYQKGSLFENLVIAELFKQQHHSGRRPAFYFWRDNHQNEVDLVWEEELKVEALEIKYSRTLHSRFFKPLQKFQSLAGEQAGASHLVYGGILDQKRHNVSVIGWKSLPNWFE